METVTETFLDALKPNDLVVVWEDGERLLVTVSQRDKVKIVVTYRVREFRFSARNGYDLSQRGRGILRKRYLDEATPEVVAAIRLEERRDIALAAIHRARVDSLPVEVLEQAAALLTPAAHRSSE
jgi:hypothetical protein